MRKSETKKPEKKKPTPIKPAAAELPEWFETPDDYGYQLDMWDEIDGTTIQQVDMTRDEFLALKEHLAKLRGIELPAEVQNAA